MGLWMIASMKTLMTSLLVPVWMGLVFHAEAAPPEGQVTLPYERFVELTKKEEAVDEARPPVDAVLKKADYVVEMRDGAAVVKVEWEAENFTDQWAWVAVAATGLALEPGEGAGLVVDGGEIRLLMPKQGLHRASARFPVAMGRDGVGKFAMVAAGFNRLRMTGEEAEGYEVEGALVLRGEDGASAYLLPAAATEVVLRKALPVADAPKEVEPTVWSVSGGAWVMYDGGWLEYEVRLGAILESGEGLEMELAFPDAPKGLEIESAGLRSYGRSEGGMKLLWGEGSEGERMVVLRYRMQIGADEGKWKVSVPQVDAGMMVAVGVPQGVELSGDGWMADPNPARVPGWITERAQGRKMVMGVGAVPEVEVKWLPRVETALMTIQEAKISTRVVMDGSQLTKTSYVLAHSEAGSVRWTLPGAMALLEATVGGVRVNPTDREGALEFDLPASPDGKGTVVEFSYTGAGKGLDRVAGGLDVETPSCPLFAHRIDWSIVLPDGMRLDAVESNAEPAAAPADGPAGAAWLSRLLTRGEPLRAEIFYRSINSEN
jgi:hypothetical protein